MKKKNYIGYLGNPNLKKPYADIPWSKKMIMEYKKCKENIFYFLDNYAKIQTLDHGIVQLKTYDFQRKMIQNLVDNRFNIFKLSRQASKCVSINSIVKLKNKKTNEIIEMTMGEFYELHRNKQSKL